MKTDVKKLVSGFYNYLLFQKHFQVLKYFPSYRRTDVGDM